MSVSHNHPSLSLPPQAALVRDALHMAALFHDLGKGTQLFQRKLTSAKEGGGPMADAVRHEVVSAAFWTGLVQALAQKSPHGKDETEAVFEGLASVPATGPFPAFVQAQRHVRNTMPTKGTISALCWGVKLDKSGQPKQNQDNICPHQPLMRAIAELIVTHHRQHLLEPLIKEVPTPLIDSKHVRNDTDFLGQDLDPPVGIQPLWDSLTWRTELAHCAARIMDGLKSGTRPADVATVIWDTLARNALMLGDHTGSMKKTQGTQNEGDTLWANTMPCAEDPDTRFVFADSLETHTRRVSSWTDRFFEALLRPDGGLPGVPAYAWPSAIRPHPDAGDNYAWQYHATQAAKQLTTSQQGGFFACLTAGTGTGKTRGAPSVLAGALEGEALRTGHAAQMRFTTAVGLNVLSSQSGKSYIADLGFAPEDVATLSGRLEIAFADEFAQDRGDAPDDPSGSENRLEEFSAFDAVEVFDPQNSGSPTPSTNADAHVGRLKKRTDLPQTWEEMATGSREDSATITAFLATPVVSATIDRLIRAIAAGRSRHLLAYVRLATSDLILDEVDLYSDTDLPALLRLVQICGSAGRRLIVMSATLPADIAHHLYQAYAQGYSAYARLMGVPTQIHVLLADDSPCPIETNGCRTIPCADTTTFGALYQAMLERTHQRLAHAPILRRACPINTPWEGDAGAFAQVFIEQISRFAYQAHHDHGTPLPNGQKISIGLVKLTRVAHVQSLAAHYLSYAKIPTHIVCLHSRLPRVQRAWIEDQLKGLLTRHALTPLALQTRLQSRDEFRHVLSSGEKDVQILVVASPVVETGNDLDFDFAIVDPSTPRSVVQTAGRVNRHRRTVVHTPNIAILDRYLVDLQTGRWSNPGPEHADPSSSTQETLTANLPDGTPSRSFFSLCPAAQEGTADARWCAPLPHQTHPFVDFEAKMRDKRFEAAYVAQWLAGKGGFSNWLHARFPFREKRNPSETLVYPSRSASGEVLWWRKDMQGSRLDKKRDTSQPLGLEPLHGPRLDASSTLFGQPLLDLLQKARLHPETWHVYGRIPLSNPLPVQGSYHTIHPLLGLIYANQRSSIEIGNIITKNST